MLPDDHQVNTAYNTFLDTFGEEGNLIIYGVKDSLLFTPEKFNAWNSLSKELGQALEVDLSLSVGDLQKLKKRTDIIGFEMVPLVKDSILSKKQLKKITELQSSRLLEATAAEVLRMKLKNGNIFYFLFCTL